MPVTARLPGLSDSARIANVETPEWSLLRNKPLLLAGAVLASGVLLLVVFLPQDENKPVSEPIAPSSAPSELARKVDEEFVRLYSVATEAVRNGDIEALESVFTPDGSGLRRSTRAVRSLARDSVVDHTVVEVHRTKMTFESPSEASLIAVTTLRPCVRSQQGADLTEGPAEIRRVTLWTMRRLNDQWFLHDGVLRRSAVIDDSPARCQ